MILKKRKNKLGISRLSKLMIVLQVLIVIGALTLITFFSPKLNYPYDGETLENNIIDFKFKNANAILIDENPEFSSPEKLNAKDIDSRSIILPPGTYYWKAQGLFETYPQNFTINSEVGLELNEGKLRNSGNVPIKVDEINNKGVTGLLILDIDVEYPIEMNDSSEYRGSEQ